MTLVFACYGLCIQWNYAASVMGASQTWIDIGCDGFLCLLWASRPSQVTQCLLWPSVEFFFGYPPSPLCGLRYPALIVLFTGWVLICCLFTKFCHLCCSCPSSCAGVHLSTRVISQYVPRPRAETASPSLAKHLGPRQGSFYCT